MKSVARCAWLAAAKIARLSAVRTSSQASPRLDVSARIARAECFFGATGATLAHGGNRACYRPSTDSIVLPLFETFRDAESYYATLAHETTHDADFRIMPRRTQTSSKSGTFRRGYSA
jgi:antirestriction protein ArdC